MLVDILLAVLLAATGVGMTFLGVHVTIHPPEDDTKKKKRKRLFYALGTIAVLITIAQGFWNGHKETTNSEQMTALKSKIDDLTSKPLQMVVQGFIQPIGVIPPDDTPFLTVGSPIKLNPHFANVGGSPVYGAKHIADILIVRINSTNDTEVRNQFKAKVAKMKENDKSDGLMLGRLGDMWRTVKSNSPLTNDDLSDIVSGRLRVYLLDHVWWKENSDGFTTCYWLQPPGKRYPNFKDYIWHGCD